MLSSQMYLPSGFAADTVIAATVPTSTFATISTTAPTTTATELVYYNIIADKLDPE